MVSKGPSLLGHLALNEVTIPCFTMRLLITRLLCSEQIELGSITTMSFQFWTQYCQDESFDIPCHSIPALT